MAPTKRKRPERSAVDAGENRPSPHRPGNTNLGQHDRRDMRDGGGRRPSRGGQGGQGVGRGRRIDGRDNPNRHTGTTGATPTPSPIPPSRSTSATQALNPITDILVGTPKPDPASFDYEFITADRMLLWDTSGRQEVVAAGIQAYNDESLTDLATIFQELIRATLDIRIDATNAGNCVKEILRPDTAPADGVASAFDPQTLFIDTLSMICDAEPGIYEPGKFPQALRAFTVATGVSPTALRQKLDGLLLQNLGLTRDTFIRVGIRQATHLLYRQANYNLLREETEGYSKLVTELFTISGSEPPSAEVVEDAFEKVKGLIGTFDLDVGRVLDITLDVFAAVLIKHYRFFIKLLRVSSWWPRNGETGNIGIAKCAGLPMWALPSSAGWTSTEDEEELSRQQRSSRDAVFWARARDVGLDAFFELGGRQVVSPEAKQRIFAGDDDDAELDADRQWIEGTGTYPPSGNRIAAQLLGFKLRFYTSGARDKNDILPANLIYLTALLIKIGFLSLRDLYPHLWPFDADMDNVRELRRKELEEKERLNRPGGAANALMMAGALVDDTLPNGGRPRETAAAKADSVTKTTTEIEDDDTLDEPMDQKVQLLTCLLTIGAIPESLFILGKFPWLPEAYPELLDLIHRIIHHSIKDVYDMSRPNPDQDPECPTKQVADSDQSGVPKGQVRLVQTPVRKQLRWPFPDKFDTNEGNSYRFYWDEWADNVPVCQTVDDVFTLCGTFLNYSGVCIGRDASLLSKFARIGARSLATDSSQHNLDRWQDLLKRLLVPALSLTKSNTSVVNEIYDMLRYYPVSVRYLIYSEWFEGQTSRLPAMKVAFSRARLETLSTMKRISMTNITTMARSLAKTAYASPGVVFSVALSQIEAYTNLTEVVVECAKYFSDLGYDVLVWSLMSSLGGKDRNRTNSEFALLPSRWLLALSRFSGKVFRRYSIMNLSPILQYVNDQLYRGNSTDLVILKELVAQMAGVVPDTDFTDAQLTAMTGGKLLRKQTLINLQDKRYESVKTAKRLMKALTETKLAGQLLISIAQHKQCAIYSISDDEAHIKLLATMIDDTQLILFQYLDLLCSNLDVDEFDNHVPGIPELLTDFGLDPALAFMIGRTSLADRISNIASPALNGTTETLAALPEPSPAKIDSDGDIGMDVGTEVQANGEFGSYSEPIHVNGVVTATGDDVQLVELKEPTPPPVTISDSTSSSSNAFHDVIEPIIDTVRALQPDDTWKAISPEFYVTFWTAGLADLSIPKDSYEREILRIAEEQKVVMKDRSDMTRLGMARKEEMKKALDETRAALISEFGKQVGAYRQRRGRLLKGKSLWFESSAKPDVVSDAVLERCLIPRLLLSPSDADFCFKMIKFLHDNSTPNFRTLSLYGRLFRANRLRSIIFTCTVREAENLGRFLRLVLAEFARWHTDAAVYEKEAWGVNKNLPGFAKALDSDGKPKALFEYDTKQGFGFKALLLTWHRALNTALRDCLDGKEWMHIRNAITILKSVVDVFPAIDFMGNGFMKQLEVVTKREKDVREDLSLTGNAVLVQLKKKSNSWVMVQAFGSNLVCCPTNYKD
jgi:THO complex subunit 2